MLKNIFLLLVMLPVNAIGGAFDPLSFQVGEEVVKSVFPNVSEWG